LRPTLRRETAASPGRWSGESPRYAALASGDRPGLLRTRLTVCVAVQDGEQRLAAGRGLQLTVWSLKNTATTAKGGHNRNITGTAGTPRHVGCGGGQV
jgi:hypothetical protein